MTGIQTRRYPLKLTIPLLLSGIAIAQVAQSPAGQSESEKSPPAPASAQSAPSPEMVLKVTTRLVVVDVVVRDRKEQSVTDLEATDFTLREDGVEQKISAFTFQWSCSTA